MGWRKRRGYVNFHRKVGSSNLIYLLMMDCGATGLPSSTDGICTPVAEPVLRPRRAFAGESGADQKPEVCGGSGEDWDEVAAGAEGGVKKGGSFEACLGGFS